MQKDELRQLIDISQKSGHVQEQQQQLIHRVFEFAEAKVRDAMIPRVSVDTLSADATLDETKTAFRTLGYSRLPVYRDRVDNIIGVLFRRDLEPFLESPVGFDLEKLLHPALFIPETAKLGLLLRRMQSARIHLAIVVDEHGGMEGVVTLEDLLEEIVGEIDDEYDEEVRLQIINQPDGTYLLDGMLAIHDANRQLNLNLPENDGYTTLAGFLMAQTGQILETGETVEYEGARFTVERVNKRRVRRVRLILPEKNAANE